MLKKFISLSTLLVLAACSTNNVSAPEEKSPEQDVSIATAEQPVEGKETTVDINGDGELSGEQLLNRLVQGGNVIYFRHATTERDYADQADPSMSLEDCSTQRKLSLQGIQESHAIGLAFAQKQIPVDRVVTSEYCRAWKTANFAFGRVDQRDSRLNFLPYEDYSDELVELMKKNVMPLLSNPPANDSNTVIIGHDDLFEAATGIYPEPQGIAYILEPNGDKGFKIIGNLLPTDWNKL